MGGNDLNGGIPDALGKLKKLQKLKINSSNLTGSIPVTLCELGRLFELNLENNQLSHPLLGCLGNISSLRKIYLGHNELTSVELSALWTNKDLQIVDLSYNNLNGSLGSEIGSCKANTTRSSSKTRVLKYVLPSVALVIILTIIMIWLTTRCNRKTVLASQSSSLITVKRISYYDIHKSTNNFDDENLIGRGSIGSVYKRTFFDGMIAAIKKSCQSVALVIILAIIMIWLTTRCNRKTALASQSSSLITVKRISYYDIHKSTNNFDDENLIGRGSIGSVYKGTFFDGMIAAIKVFNLNLETANKSFDTECNMLCNIRHRNLVTGLGRCKPQF
ncbi:unnamed protein product [Fraxinus pennsylvanica]|uniref:Protein kinase domain-containing protein n=1 Tax=Fraxinus pennsylvanica TaxID=56036 RepID=A0AAD2AA35_9LAMI|nr:unnamed protein product [Fraxinus pennsylvanica]